MELVRPVYCISRTIAESIFFKQVGSRCRPLRGTCPYLGDARPSGLRADHAEEFVLAAQACALEPTRWFARRSASCGRSPACVRTRRAHTAPRTHRRAGGRQRHARARDRREPTGAGGV